MRMVGAAGGGYKPASIRGGEVLVFSYGSNLCRARLRARAPSARFGPVAVLRGHALRFHKRSNVDGSGKADARATGRREDRVCGVLARLSPSDKEALDRAEGVGEGYRDLRAEVETRRRERLRAHLYVAEEGWIEPALRPFDWYLDLVVAGARSHRLPRRYVRALEATESDPDPDPARRRANLEALAGC